MWYGKSLRMNVVETDQQIALALQDALFSEDPSSQKKNGKVSPPTQPVTTATTPSPLSSNNSNRTWGDWFAQAQTQAVEIAVKAQELTEIATKAAQEKAKDLATQANEMRQNYDMELAASIFMTTIGAPTMDSNNKGSDQKASVLSSTSGGGGARKNPMLLDLVYVTENLIAMAFPYDPKKPGNSQGGNDIRVVSSFMRKKHEGHFMVWNVSEEPYDYSMFADQVS